MRKNLAHFIPAIVTPLTLVLAFFLFAPNGGGGTALLDTTGWATLGDFGAIPNDGLDDTLAIQTAEDSGAKVIDTGGVYNVSDTLRMRYFEGAGHSAAQGGSDYPVSSPATEFVWTGPSGKPVMKIDFQNGWELSGFSIDGGNVASTGILVDRGVRGSLTDVGIRKLGPDGVGLLSSPTGSAAVNSMQNRVEGFYVIAPTIIRLEGNPLAAANSCHWTFLNVVGNYGNATTNSTGIVIQNGDNNAFYDIFLYRNYGTGHGVEFQAKARANYFFHLQAGSGGVIARTPAQTWNSNLIVGYDRENAQPEPVKEAGAKLEWTETGRLATGWHITVAP